MCNAKTNNQTLETAQHKSVKVVGPFMIFIKFAPLKNNPLYGTIRYALRKCVSLFQG